MCPGPTEEKEKVQQATKCGAKVRGSRAGRLRTAMLTEPLPDTVLGTLHTLLTCSWYEFYKARPLRQGLILLQADLELTL